MLGKIDNELQMYASRGFNVIEMLMDPEFDPMEKELRKRGVCLNPTSAKKHVPEIERQIRVIKEHARAKLSRLPLKKVPNLMITEMIKDIITWLYNFPPKGGILVACSGRNSGMF
jgi:hypothetical protein